MKIRPTAALLPLLAYLSLAYLSAKPVAAQEPTGQAPPTQAPSAQAPSGQAMVIRDSEGGKAGSYRASYALVIGISDYREESWSDLAHVPQELKDVRQILRGHGFKIIKGPENATSKELRSAFQDFFGRYGANPNHRLLVYFSGHGYSFRDAKRGFLVPSDAPNPATNRLEFLRKALHMSRITAGSLKVNAAHILYLFDSCFSGALFDAEEIAKSPSAITESTMRPVRQFIRACSAGEQTPTNGLFKSQFVRALQGDANVNGDRYVTGTELGSYLLETVTTEFPLGQTPQFGKSLNPDHNQGDFVFRLPKKKGKKSAAKKQASEGQISEPRESQKPATQNPRRPREKPQQQAAKTPSAEKQAPKPPAAAKPKLSRPASYGTPEAPFVGPPPAGTAATQLSAVQLLQPETGSSVKIAGNGEFAYSTFRLEGPLRFVIDLSGVVNRFKSSKLGSSGSELKQVRVAQFQPSPNPVSRIVFDLHHWSPPTIERGEDGLVIWFPPRSDAAN